MPAVEIWGTVLIPSPQQKALVSTLLWISGRFDTRARRDACHKNTMHWNTISKRYQVLHLHSFSTWGRLLSRTSDDAAIARSVEAARYAITSDDAGSARSVEAVKYASTSDNAGGVWMQRDMRAPATTQRVQGVWRQRDM